MSPVSLSGTVLGIVLSVIGVVGPVIGVIAWLLVTNSYRLSKHRIVRMVEQHLKIEDIAEDHAGFDPKLALPFGTQPSGANMTEIAKLSNYFSKHSNKSCIGINSGGVKYNLRLQSTPIWALKAYGCKVAAVAFLFSASA